MPVCVCVRACLYDCTSLDVCIGWQIADRQRVQQQVMGGGSGLISCSALSSYRSTSILFSSCQNSQLCIDSSLLHLIFTQTNNKARTKQTAGRWNLLKWPQNKCFHQKVSHWSPENTDQLSLRRLRALRPNPQDNSLTGKNTESFILVKATEALVEL